MFLLIINKPLKVINDAAMYRKWETSVCCLWIGNSNGDISKPSKQIGFYKKNQSNTHIL